MKLRNEQVLNVFGGLNTLGNEKFSAKLAWKISTARATLSPFVESLEKTIAEVRTKYAIRDADGNIVPAFDNNGMQVEGTMQVERDKIQVLNSELMGLLAAETEVANVTLSVADFPDTFEVSPNVLQSLQPILSE
jgi:hypothetical protein